MNTTLISIILAFSLVSDPSGLKVGEKVPDFTGKDQNGKEINLYETLEDQQVILTFYRGAWCKYCMGQFKDYQDSISLITAKGAAIIAISPEHEDGIQKTAKTSKASWSLIHDDGLKIMQAFKVISDAKVAEYQSEFEATAVDNQHKFLPVPATYVIGNDGVIKYVYFDPNYKVRATVKALLEQL